MAKKSKSKKGKGKSSLKFGELKKISFKDQSLLLEDTVVYTKDPGYDGGGPDGWQLGDKLAPMCDGGGDTLP